MAVRVRRDGYGEFLPGMWRKAAGGGRMDLRLRHGEQGQILLELRREKAGRETALCTMRLGAGRRGAVAEVLPGMRP